MTDQLGMMPDRQEGVAATTRDLDYLRAHGLCSMCREPLTEKERALDAAALGWRSRLNGDTRPEAAVARSAYNSMVICEPSYYADKGNAFAYELAREQTAEALSEWRRTSDG